MKAEELMIGDWVQGFLPDTYSEVVGIPNEKRVAIMGGGAYMEVSDEDIQPIPITHDILMGNGFTLAKRGKTWHFSDGDTLISWSEWGRMVISSKGASHGNRLNCDCRYVHQLQHALRLFGIEKEIRI